MPKFELNQRVRINHDGNRLPGRVSSRTGRMYSVFTDDRRLLKNVSVGQLRTLETEYALILEGNLAQGLGSYDRRFSCESAEFLGQFLRTLGYCPIVEKVHSRDSLRHFIRDLGSKKTVRYVHLSSHGHHEPGIGQELLLTHDSLEWPLKPFEYWRRRAAAETPKGRELIEDALKEADFLRETFEGALEGKILLLSACALGRAGGIAQMVSRVSAATAVLAYEGDISICDSMCAEPLLYRCLEKQTKKMTPARIAGAVREVLATAGLKVPLVVWSRGERVS